MQPLMAMIEPTPVWKVILLFILQYFWVAGLILITILFLTKRRSGKGRLFLPVIVMLALLTVLDLGLNNLDQIMKIKRLIFPEVSRQTINEANQYIISRMGEGNFDKYIKLRLDLSYTYKENNMEQVAYSFEPLAGIVGDNIIRMEKVNLEINQASYDDITIPKCVQDASLCNFALTKKQWQDIREEYDFHESTEVFPPYIVVYQCKSTSRGVFHYKESIPFRIDYRNGSVEEGFPVGYPNGGGVFGDIGPCNPPQA
jgi:hypothetical protein